MIVRQASIYLLLVCIFASCSTQKRAANGSIYTPERTKKELIQAIDNHNYDFTWFTGKGTLKLESDFESITASSHIRIRKDSIIWGVAKKFGIEAGRIFITPKSYAVINRIERTYQQGNTDQALQNFGINLDFYDTQELIFGNIMLPDSIIAINKKENSYHINTYLDEFTTAVYDINAADLTLSSVQLKDPYRSIHIVYEDYKVVDRKTKLAHTRTYEVNDAYGLTKIKLSFSKVTLDIPKNTKFTIPPHYDKVE